MRQAKQWLFVRHPSKPPLSMEEVRYWKGTIPSILKIGLEFEYNLNCRNGSCKGDNFACPCTKLSSERCWEKCLLEAQCKKIPNNTTCNNYRDTCPNKCPKDCEAFKFKCLSLSCSSFTSKCLACEAYTVDCASCKELYDPNKNPDAIRKKLINKLKPTKNYGNVGPHGINSVTKDGSLKPDGGVEVITNGRRVNYAEFYKMTKNIIESVRAKGGFLDERCSIHMHLLATYYDGIAKELERSVPEVVMANFHQLCRKFECPITWMSMALDTPEKMTRWEKFRVSVLDVSPLTESMRSVKERVISIAGGRKYGWVNYCFLQFDGNNDISQLHVEMRVMDGNNSPTAVTAMAMLFYAMLVKAVEISRYGILKLDDTGDWFYLTRKAKEAMLNNNPSGWGNNRFSDTSGLPEYFEFLRTEAEEMLHQLKHILMKCGPAYDVLMQLAMRPPALRLCDGNTWEQIEADLEVKMEEEDLFKLHLDKYVDMRAVYDCTSMEEWLEEIAQVFKGDSDFSPEVIDANLRGCVEDMQRSGELLWSATLGTMVKV